MSDISESGIGTASWLKGIPGHWKTKALKFCADPINEKTDGSGQGVRYVGLEHIEGKTGRFVTETVGFQEVAESTLNVFATNDVLFGKLRPYLRKVAVADSDGTCSSEILVFRPHSLIPEYLKHVMLLDPFIEHVNASTYGSKMPRADPAFVSRVPVPQPPEDEQVAIAAYLGIETTRIDGLLEEKRRLLRLLDELRQNVVRAMTSGLGQPGKRRVTENHFIPSVPDHWTFVPLRRYSTITNGSTPLKNNPAFWSGGDYPWLNSSVVNEDDVWEASELVTSEALRTCHLPVVPPGSVLIALTGQGKTRGQASVLRIEATINQHLAAIICEDDHLDGEFVFWALTAQYGALRMVSDGQGTTKGALTCDELGRFHIPKPPIDEQQAIARAVYTETAKIDGLINHVAREIELLRELRTATITDAVLGRIGVTGDRHAGFDLKRAAA